MEVVADLVGEAVNEGSVTAVERADAVVSVACRTTTRIPSATAGLRNAILTC